MDHIADNEFAPGLVRDESGIDILDHCVRAVAGHAEVCRSRDYDVIEGRHIRHRADSQAVARWPTLHVDDRMMPVFPRRRCRQSNHEPRFDLAHHPLKCESRKMVALVNNHVSIFGNKVLDLPLAMQALNNRYVDASSPFGFAPGRFGRSRRLEFQRT